jgi:L-rhamnose mutarotase
MQRVCFSLQLKRDRLAEYKERHREVWPEMQAALRETGWTNYSLFVDDDGLLVGYLETDDFERALSEMEKRKVNEKWQREMAAFFEGPEGSPDRKFKRLEEVFHLDSNPRSP